MLNYLVLILMSVAVSCTVLPEQKTSEVIHFGVVNHDDGRCAFRMNEEVDMTLYSANNMALINTPTGDE